MEGGGRGGRKLYATKLFENLVYLLSTSTYQVAEVCAGATKLILALNLEHAGKLGLLLRVRLFM